MNNSDTEKKQAQKEKLEAQFEQLQAQIKEAGADGKIFIQDKIDKLKEMLND